MPAVDPSHIACAVSALREPWYASGGSLDERQAHAFDVIYRSYSAMLLATARRMVVTDSDAEDVLHDVFTRLPRILVQYRGGGLGGWLKRVTQREALMQMRRTRCRREEQLLDQACGDILANCSRTLDPDGFLNGALARLAQPLREVVVLRMYHDYSHQQIAVALGISPTASEVRLCRALKRLRADLLDARTPPLRRSA